MKNAGGFVLQVNLSSGSGIKGKTSGNMSAGTTYYCAGFRNKSFGIVLNAYTGFFNTTTHACSISVGDNKFIKFKIGGTLYNESCTAEVNEDVTGTHIKDCANNSNCDYVDIAMFDNSDGDRWVSCTRPACVANANTNSWNVCNCKDKDW